ncbi:GIP [Symbiodinium sp. CCMP2592]|nr:GIP [Symbiodinium sp. CCMP2592]
MKSQCGYVVGLTSDALKEGTDAPVYIAETYSGSVKRVCRSTLAPESNGFLAGVEAAACVHMILLEIRHPTERILDLNREFYKKQILCLRMPRDKRVKILLAQLKELLGTNTYDDDSAVYAIWVDTSQMLADVLTKCGCEPEPLLDAVYSGIAPSAEAQEKKMQIRAGRHARKHARREAEDG